MAILQALIAALTRSAGKVLNTVFAWATVLLFGRVSEDRQIYVSAIAFGSVIWLVVLTGVAFPSFATFMLSFVPLPKWVEKTWIRLAMLSAVVVLPALVGVASYFMLDPHDRPRGAGGVVKTVLKGYPYTVGLALTLAMMTAFAPVFKIRALAKRWTSEHVPVVIESKDYPAVVDAAQKALEAGGVKTERRRASWMLRLPTKVLTVFARGAVGGLVAEEMTTLVSDTVEVSLHPSDLVISGREATAARTRAILAKRLVFTPAHLTWDKEANRLEDRLLAIWNARRGGRPAAELRRELRAVEAELDRLEIPYEEWEVLFREVLLVDRALSQGAEEVSPDLGAWATRLGAGLVVAAPHVARAAESLADVAKELRRTGETTPRAACVTESALDRIATTLGLSRWWRQRRAERDKELRRRRRAA